MSGFKSQTLSGEVEMIQAMPLDTGKVTNSYLTNAQTEQVITLKPETKAIEITVMKYSGEYESLRVSISDGTSTSKLLPEGVFTYVVATESRTLSYSVVGAESGVLVHIQTLEA